jgi:hypothetical protein
LFAVSVRVHVGGRGGVVITVTIPRFTAFFIDRGLFRGSGAVVVGGLCPPVVRCGLTAAWKNVVFLWVAFS